MPHFNAYPFCMRCEGTGYLRIYTGEGINIADCPCTDVSFEPPAPTVSKTTAKAIEELQDSIDELIDTVKETLKKIIEAREEI